MPEIKLPNSFIDTNLFKTKHAENISMTLLQIITQIKWQHLCYCN